MNTTKGAATSTAAGSSVSTRKRTTFLRNALLANSVFSTLCALIFILFVRPLSAFLGWSSLWVVSVIGSGLLVFALYVLKVARASELNTSAVKNIMAADVAWVVLSIVVIVTSVVPLTLGGKWGVGIVADIVGLFALFQFFGLRRTEVMS